MNRITVFADVAGRPSREVTWSPRITAGAVALPTADLDVVRNALPSELTKWKSIDDATANAVVQLLGQRAVGVVATSINKDTPAWSEALQAETVLQSAITRQSGETAGWAKLPVVLLYQLLMRSGLLALTHFLKQDRSPRILDHRGLAAIECSIVCDEEFSGTENVEVFQSFWGDENVPAANLAALGYHVRHPSATLTTDSAEPLLRLADVVAGLAHSAYIPEPGRLRMPLSCTQSRELLARLHSTGKLTVETGDYDESYDRIFGSTMSLARGARDA